MCDYLNAWTTSDAFDDCTITVLVGVDVVSPCRTQAEDKGPCFPILRHTYSTYTYIYNKIHIFIIDIICWVPNDKFIYTYNIYTFILYNIESSVRTHTLVPLMRWIFINDLHFVHFLHAYIWMYDVYTFMIYYLYVHVQHICYIYR